MVFHWLRERRRAQILAHPFPSAWRGLMSKELAHFAQLNDAERQYLEQLVQVFVAEKHFEGCAGLELDDEMRVTIAADACLLLLGLPHDMYREVDSILVYPTTVVRPQHARSVFDASLRVEPTRDALIGEAHMHGPVILAWDAVQRGSRNPGLGHNVVFHEFAHKLDMLDGSVDGTPPLRNGDELRRWAEVCSQSYLQLRADHEAGRHSFLDPYAAQSEAEFFAVATEVFFCEPVELQAHSPELYAVLQAFYRQDPARRVQRA
jgi:Mlc titration factor MtfA (ptsG expression regulator)